MEGPIRKLPKARTKPISNSRSTTITTTRPSEGGMGSSYREIGWTMLSVSRRDKNQPQEHHSFNQKSGSSSGSNSTSSHSTGTRYPSELNCEKFERPRED